MQLTLIKLNWRKVLTLSAVFLFTGIFLGCKKHQNGLGTDVLDPNSLLASGGVDTFTLITSSFYEDSSRTDNQAFGMVGAYLDPKFGVMSASVYTQFRLVGIVHYFPTDVFRIDSCILALEYGGFYGKPTAQTFEVYQLADQVYVDSSYFRSSYINHATGNLIAPEFNATITPDFASIVKIGPNLDTLDPQLRLRLDTNWAQSLLAEARDGIGFSSNENFLTYFKGLHIKVANETPSYGGSITYFRMTDPDSKLTIYYHENNDTVQSQFDIVLNSSGKYFNHVEIDNAGTPVDQVVTNGTLNNQQEFYAQANHVKGHIDVPGIDQLSKKALIHDALLVLPIEYQTGEYLTPPETIIVTYKVGELVYGSSATYDNTYKAYVVDVRPYIQAVALGQIENLGLSVYPSNMGGSADRLIINGRNTFNKTKPSLILKYTDYN